MDQEDPKHSLTRRGLLRTGGAALLAASGAGLATATTAGAAVALPTPALAEEPVRVQWQPGIVHYGSDGDLMYGFSANRSRIPDFSWAGYRNGEVPVPILPTVKTISPVSGDNTAHIQAALDEVGQRVPDANGFRGALLLRAGTYPVAGTIRINRSGVVLRGVGASSDPAQGAIIRATGKAAQAYVIIAGGSTASWTVQVPGTRTNIVTDFVRVGARRFTVADSSALSVGDNIVIFHPCTQAWLNAIDGGDTGNQPPWAVGERPIVYNRYIKAIEGNDILVCAPVFNHLDRSLAQSYVYVWDNTGLVRNVGVESLRIHVQTTGSTDENHAWTAIGLQRVEDAWVQRVTALHFGFAAVETTSATRCTIQDVSGLAPHSQITGSRRYPFNVKAYSQQILFRDLQATYARHAFASSGTSTAAGCVWLDGTSQNGYTESGGHHRWSQGLLFDNIKELNNSYGGGHVISLHCRGGSGTGHGWSSVHSVAWHCTVNNGKHVAIQRPPTAQNYGIGTVGACNGNGLTSQPTGHIEGTNTSGLRPESLYQAQLEDRLGAGPGTRLPVVAVTASGDDGAGNVAARAIDGNLGTRWSHDANGAWLRLDLGAVKQVAAVAVAWYDGVSRRTTFEVATSTDGTAWTTVVARRESSGVTLRHEVCTFAARSARYVRITGYGNTLNAWTSITEVSVHRPSTKLEIVSVVASGDDGAGNVAANAVDRSLDTRWSGEGAGAWIRFALGGARSVDMVSVAWYQGDTRRTSFEIETSLDLANWTVAVPRRQSSGTTLQLENYAFTPRQARYVRITGYGSNVNAWNSITQVSVHGS